jgi:hypothetical protein
MRRNREFPFENLGDLPAAYGADRIELLPRDATWLHCYWEITAARAANARERLRDPSCVLRVFCRQGEDVSETAYDVAVPIESRRYYLNVPASDATYRVAIGFVDSDGSFTEMAASGHVVAPPRVAASPAGDQFVTIPFERPIREHLAAAGGRGEVRLDAQGRVLTTEEWERLFGAATEPTGHPTYTRGR